MKKEVVASLILILLIICSFAVISKTEKICGHMAELTEESAQSAAKEQWSAAEGYAQKALEYWYMQRSFTHIFLRHGEVENTTASIYQYLAALYQREAGNIKAAAMEACAHYSSLSTMEKIRLGSIF